MNKDCVPSNGCEEGRAEETAGELTKKSEILQNKDYWYQCPQLGQSLGLETEQECESLNVGKEV